MTAAVRKYNPGFLSEDELVNSFCVRTHEFESAVQALHETPVCPSVHQLLIGPRGSGKTSLILRIAAEIRRDAELARRFFPIVFAEESYEVASAGEFWLECLSRLAEQAPRGEAALSLSRTHEELRTVSDDRILGERCLGALLDFSDQLDKRLVVMAENLNMMFNEMSDQDAGWRLRKTLQTEPRIILLASATSRFEEIDNPDQALYELFRVLSLQPLTTEECAVLCRAVSGKNRAPETISALRILTGGSPRLIAIVARFGANLSFRNLMADLLDLVDDHTEYFKSHLEVLPAQERRVYLALASLWKPATAREIAVQARLDTSKCSAQLGRLVTRGTVEVDGGSARRKRYYLAERLYNIYYLMRRSGRLARLVEAVVQFMEAFYSPSELHNVAARMIQDSRSVDTAAERLFQAALARLIKLPALASYRQQLLLQTPQHLAYVRDGDPPEKEEAVAADSRTREMDILEQVLVECNQALQRYEHGKKPEKLISFARTLAAKGALLCKHNRYEESIAVLDQFLERFESSDEPALLEEVSRAIVWRGLAFSGMGRPEEAMSSWDQCLRRFGASQNPAFRGMIAMAWINKGTELARLERAGEAVSAWDEAIRRFGESNEPEMAEVVAQALVNKGATLILMDQIEEGLAVWDDFVERCGDSDAPTLMEKAAKCLHSKALVLREQNRPEEAVAAWNEITRRFRAISVPEVGRRVEIAQLNIAMHQIYWERYDAAIQQMDQLLDANDGATPENAWRGHLVRAWATVKSGDQARGMMDLEVALASFPDSGSLAKADLDALVALAVELEPQEILGLVQTSIMAEGLLPFITALERELGIESLVPREVKDVAKDIQQEMRTLRQKKDG